MDKKLYDLIESTVKNGSVSDEQRELILDKALWLDMDVDEVENILDEKLKLSRSNYNKDAESVYLKQSENHQRTDSPQSNQELQSLIEMAIADGMITDNERKVVLKKAVSLGFDKDEVEMILDGKLSLFLNEQNNNQPIKKNSKEGEILKCPACGSISNALDIKCLDCGYEFRNKEVNENTERLFELLKEVDNTPSPTRIRESRFGDENEDAKDDFLDDLARRKCQIINTFPISNTKEDIVEFLVKSIPLAKRANNFMDRLYDSPEKRIREAWASKGEEVILKARLLFRDDSKMMEEINLFADELGLNSSSVTSTITSLLKKKMFDILKIK